MASGRSLCFGNHKSIGERIFENCSSSIRYLFKNLFQNSIDFAQREYRFAIFKCGLIRAEGFLRRLCRL